TTRIGSTSTKPFSREPRASAGVTAALARGSRLNNGGCHGGGRKDETTEPPGGGGPDQDGHGRLLGVRGRILPPPDPRLPLLPAPDRREQSQPGRSLPHAARSCEHRLPADEQLDGPSGGEGPAPRGPDALPDPLGSDHPPGHLLSGGHGTGMGRA